MEIIIKSIYLELVDQPTPKLNYLSGVTQELILKMEMEDKTEFIQFSASNDKVAITKRIDLEHILEGSLLENVLFEEEICSDESTRKYGCFPIVQVSQLVEFENYVNQKIKKIELESYLSHKEDVGYRITLANSNEIELFPNSYGSTVYFNKVDRLYPKKIKYLAGETIYTNVEMEMLLR